MDIPAGRRSGKIRTSMMVVTALMVLILIGIIATWTKMAVQNNKSEEASESVGGNAERGQLAMEKFGCAACHIIPGVRGAVMEVGPSLAGFSNQKTIVGVAPNNQENLVRWIMNPSAMDPQTTMPTFNLSRKVATDIATYLNTLK